MPLETGGKPSGVGIFAQCCGYLFYKVGHRSAWVTWLFVMARVMTFRHCKE